MLILGKTKLIGYISIHHVMISVLQSAGAAAA